MSLRAEIYHNANRTQEMKIEHMRSHLIAMNVFMWLVVISLTIAMFIESGFSTTEATAIAVTPVMKVHNAALRTDTPTWTTESERERMRGKQCVPLGMLLCEQICCPSVYSLCKANFIFDASIGWLLLILFVTYGALAAPDIMFF